MKRFLFVSICYIQYLRTHSSIQLIVLTLVFFLTSYYTGLYSPYIFWQDNIFAAVNEWFFCIYLYLMMCYTDFIVNPEAKFTVGWINIIVICFQIMMNIIYIIYRTSSEFKKRIIYSYNYIMYDK